MAKCCTCSGAGGGSGGGGSGPGATVNGLPLICLVPRDEALAGKLTSAKANGGSAPSGPSSSPAAGAGMGADFQFLDEDYIQKHFNLSPRALYLDPFRRPLITFPLVGENTANFNMARKTKTNQMILDGLLDPSAAIVAPSVFPYATSEAEKQKKAEEEEEEIIYILQLPDWEIECPVHNTTIRTPRFIWHSCKKSKDSQKPADSQGGGPLKRPKPWILSRCTDFDMQSQW